MTYRELFYKATRLINKGDITLGEYEELTKPLDREIEQKPVLDKVKAEIVDLGQRTMNDNRASGIWACRDIIDKYIRQESETNNG